MPPPSSRRRPVRPGAATRPAPSAHAATPKAAPLRPLNEAERDELQAVLDRVPAPLEALDVSMLDGFLCGVLVQPERLPVRRWLAHVSDVDGRPLPAGFDGRQLEALTLRRHAELDDAIARRRWFDPWVYELEDEPAERPPSQIGGAEGNDDDEGESAPPGVDAVYPWVAGFATALELFPGLLRLDAKRLDEPLALLYRHLSPDDLEDADDLLETIASLEPPADLAEAVEGLVRATLLLADVGRPLAVAPRRPGR